MINHQNEHPNVKLVKRHSVVISFKDVEPLTEQHHKDEVKIQNVLGKAKRLGVATHVNAAQGMYMDMTSAPAFTEAQNAIAEAKSIFETVPAEIRRDFDNNYGKFIDFMQNPENKAKIDEYGFDSSHLDVLEVPESPSQGDSHLQVDLDTLIAEKVAEELKNASGGDEAK